MSDFYINTDKIISDSQEIISIATRINEIQGGIESISLNSAFECYSKYRISKSIKKLIEEVADEATKMDSFGDALDYIANRYRRAENTICSSDGEMVSSIKAFSGKVVAFKTASGKDKRGWLEKLWDKITGNKPDKYDKTTKEQEKAADEAMRMKLWKVLQNEKYSRENWAKLSIKERKKLLQEYMDEVMRIYGLKGVVSSKINWSKETYNNNEVTFGYYSDGIFGFGREITLNENVLTDAIGIWDSYELLGTVAHELRHAYQHEAVRNPSKYLVSQDTLDKWSKNIKDYISYDPNKDNFNDYYNQIIEVDARSFEVDRDVNCCEA